MFPCEISDITKWIKLDKQWSTLPSAGQYLPQNLSRICCDKEAQGADVAKKHFKIQNPCKHLWEVLPLMSHRGSDLALISETHEDNIKPFHWKTESFIWG